MTPDQEHQERLRLAATPGLSKAQKLSILDPEFAVRSARTLIEVLKRQAAEQYAQKPEEARALDAAMGVQDVVQLGVQNSGVMQTFGELVPVAKVVKGV